MLELLDYRRQVFSLYSDIRNRQNDDPVATWDRFCRTRDSIFASHPQSAFSDRQKDEFEGLEYFSHDPSLRFTVAIDRNVSQTEFAFDAGADGVVKSRRFADVVFRSSKGVGRLSLFWILGYGGGVFLPFRDATNATSTYGGGRYLYDTIKGSDLGGDENTIVLDFNYAYNPSCAYNPRWVCPLSPSENRLEFAIEAGEKRWEGYYG